MSRRVQTIGASSLSIGLITTSLMLHFLTHAETLVFITSCLAIVPLAFFMGKATEAIAERSGPAIGGLLNATFGNAAELIIAFTAMRAGMDTVVKASLTGSIIGNILFVFGMAMVVGGVRRNKQTFNATAASTSATMLLVAVAGLVLPAAFVGFSEYHQALDPDWVGAEPYLGPLSTAIAVVLLLSYLAGLVFSLITHRHLYDGDAPVPDEHHEPEMSLRSGVIVLVVATAGVALMSELLVHSVEAASHRLGFTETFVGVFVIAIVGNAAEHSAAVWMAAKDKMDLAIGIAVESSKQIALFVGPLLVLASLVLRDEQMTLAFAPMEVLAVVVCTVILKFTCDDGESNWLEGVQLICLYLILGIVFYFTP